MTRRDLRQSTPNLTLNLHEVKIGTVSVQNDHLITASNDRSCCLWDTRNVVSDGDKKNFSTAYTARFETGRACTAAYFHPRNPLVLVTSYDDTLRILDAKDALNLLSEIKHNNQTGRWITPFKAQWDPKSIPLTNGGQFVCGSMDRVLDVFCFPKKIDDDQKLAVKLFTSYSPLLTSQPAVNAVHPALDLVFSGNASGKIILWTPASSSS